MWLMFLWLYGKIFEYKFVGYKYYEYFSLMPKFYENCRVFERFYLSALSNVRHNVSGCRFIVFYSFYSYKWVDVKYT